MLETKGGRVWVSEAPEFLMMSPAVRGGQRKKASPRGSENGTDTSHHTAPLNSSWVYTHTHNIPNTYGQTTQKKGNFAMNYVMQITIPFERTGLMLL